MDGSTSPDPFSSFVAAVQHLPPHGKVPWQPPVRTWERTFVEPNLDRLIQVIQLLGWMWEMEVARRDNDYVLRVRSAV